jgi:hypothetical protein
MQLQVGDKLGDETGDWEGLAVHTRRAGKKTEVRVQRVDKRQVTKEEGNR